MNACHLAVVIMSGVAFAQPAADAPEPEDSGADEQAQDAEPLPGLDDLLGLPEQEAADEEGAARRAETPDAESPDDAELERKLTGEAGRQALEEAVGLMGDVASRINVDTGLTTQRLQEDILRKLDMVIDAAEQQQQQQSSSSSSSSSSSQQQSAQQSQPQQSTAQQRRGQRGQQSGESMPPDLQGVETRTDLVADTAAWGSLPQRVREELRQGISERFSTVYQRFTEDYYRRLAEESDR
jgi:hypothetical protein